MNTSSTKHSAKSISFSNCKGRKVSANFKGGHISSNGGVLLLKQIDDFLGLTKKLATIIPDYRDPRYCSHKLITMLRQRIYSLALGYEDLNDHQELRQDFALQTAVNSVDTLASSSTLCRLENTANRQMALDIHKLIFRLFVKAHRKPPKRLILDFDPTDDLVHGHQVFSHYHGYYKAYCSWS